MSEEIDKEAAAVDAIAKAINKLDSPYSAMRVLKLMKNRVAEQMVPNPMNFADLQMMREKEFIGDGQ